MTPDELYNLPPTDGIPPGVLLRDGSLGLLIGYPSNHNPDSPCRVQVHGERDARRILAGDLTLHGRLLVEAGADVEAFRKSSPPA